MGCGGSKVQLEGVDCPLDYWIEPLDIPEIDSKTAPASDAIKDLEDMREKIVDKRDEIFVSTGAIAHRNPNIYKAGMCLLWKLSADNAGQINDAGIVYEQKSMAANGKKNSPEAVAAAKAFFEYCGVVSAINHKEEEGTSSQSRFEAIADKVKKISEEAKASYEEVVKKINEKVSGEQKTM